MQEEIVTLGGNMKPPCVCSETAMSIYDCVRTDEFEVDTFNALLMVIVTYLDVHNIEYGDKDLPWAESAGVEQ